MGLAFTVDKIENVPEEQRALYAEVDGKFKLQVDGLEDLSGLKTALDKERKEVKDVKAASKLAIQEALKAYEGIDPVKTRALLSKFDNEEEAALIAAGKVDEVIAKRMAKRDAAQQKLLDEALAKEKAAQGVAATFKGRVLDNHIRAAAAKAGLHAYAVDDALLRARSIFSLDDKGDAVQVGADGPVLGKDGKTPFSPGEWLEAMKETAPHWFPSGASGGGAGGGKQAAHGTTMKRSVFDALSPKERATAAKTYTIVD